MIVVLYQFYSSVFILQDEEMKIMANKLMYPESDGMAPPTMMVTSFIYHYIHQPVIIIFSIHIVPICMEEISLIIHLCNTNFHVHLSNLVYR